jgi:hypothetical protein
MVRAESSDDGSRVSSSPLLSALKRESSRIECFLTCVPRYKKRGGGYNTDKSQQDGSQKHLSEWTEEEWQTKEGSGHAKKDDGTEKRYLPKKAWEKMSEKEKEETEEKKEEGGKEGRQYVGNTEKARESRREVSGGKGIKGEKQKKDEGEDEEEDDDAAEGSQDEYQDDGADEEEVADGEEGDAAADQDDDEEEYQDDGIDGEEVEEVEEDEEVDDDDDDDTEGQNGESEEATTGQKRSRGQQNGSNKSQKNNSGKAQSKQSNGNKNGDDSGKDKSKSKSNGTVGSKHQKDEDPAPKGSADRLPKKGQAAQWKSLPGFVKGKVEDILTEAQEVDGKNVKASENDPRIVLKSDSSGKICVHKPEACYYD